MVPIMKLVTFRERVPGSSLSSTSKIGIHVEPLTHAFKTWHKHKFKSPTMNKYEDVFGHKIPRWLVKVSKNHINIFALGTTSQCHIN